MEWYLGALKQYADIRGRARRTEFWCFVLYCFLFGIVCVFLDSLISCFISQPIVRISGIYMLGMILPTLAVTARRLHDLGYTSFMILVLLIPIPYIGFLILLVLMVWDSERGTNKYGPNPKEVG